MNRFFSGFQFNEGCTTLVEAPTSFRGAYTVPDTVTVIGSTAFYSCSLLTEITLPDSVVRIDSGAFVSCIALTTAVIGRGMKEIRMSAFSGCHALKTIRYKGRKREWEKIKIAEGAIPKQTEIVFEQADEDL